MQPRGCIIPGHKPLLRWPMCFFPLGGRGDQGRGNWTLLTKPFTRGRAPAWRGKVLRAIVTRKRVKEKKMQNAEVGAWAM